MSKTQRHQSELQSLFAEFLQTSHDRNLTDYLLANSNLPGRRANLELAKAFTVVIKENLYDNKVILWDFVISLLKITPEEAPTNNPYEFLPFCGTWAVGVIGATSETHFKESLIHLKELSNDSRWRIREAVAKGLYELLAVHSTETIKEMKTWISKDEWLLMRAVVTGIADPRLLQDEQISKLGLKLHREVLTHVEAYKNRKSEEFKILKKGLAYSLSVVVQANPEEGFEYLNELAISQDNNIVWILKQNLKKNRLIKNFPSKVKALTNQLK
ncbi:MAG: hypothetical protein ACFFDC_19955 [Promethearchaeota archaeon]